MPEPTPASGANWPAILTGAFGGIAGFYAAHVNRINKKLELADKARTDKNDSDKSHAESGVQHSNNALDAQTALIQTLREKEQRQEARIDHLIERLEKISDEKAELLGKLARLANLEKQLDGQQLQIGTLQREVERLRIAEGENAYLKEQLIDTRNRLVTAEETIVELRDENNALDSSLTTALRAAEIHEVVARERQRQEKTP